MQSHSPRSQSRRSTGKSRKPWLGRPPSRSERRPFPLMSARRETCKAGSRSRLYDGPLALIRAFRRRFPWGALLHAFPPTPPSQAASKHQLRPVCPPCARCPPASLRFAWKLVRRPRPSPQPTKSGLAPFIGDKRPPCASPQRENRHLPGVGQVLRRQPPAHVPRGSDEPLRRGPRAGRCSSFPSRRRRRRSRPPGSDGARRA